MKKHLILTSAILATGVPLATVVACGKKQGFKIYSPDELTTPSDFTYDLDLGSSRFTDVDLNVGLQNAVVLKLKKLFDQITPLYVSESQYTIDYVKPVKFQQQLDGFKQDYDAIKVVWAKFQKKITESGSKYLLNSPVYFNALSGIKGVNSQIEQVQQSIIGWTNYSYKENALELVQSSDSWMDIKFQNGVLSSREFYYEDGVKDSEFAPLTVVGTATNPGWQNDGKHGDFTTFWQQEVEAQYNIRVGQDGTVNTDKFKQWLSTVLKVYGCSFADSQKPNPTYGTVAASLDTVVWRGGLPSDKAVTDVKNAVQPNWDGKSDGDTNVYTGALDNDQHRYFKSNEFLWGDSSIVGTNPIPNKKEYNAYIDALLKKLPFDPKEWETFIAKSPRVFVPYNTQVSDIGALQTKIQTVFAKAKTWKDVDFTKDWVGELNGANLFCLRPATSTSSSVWSEEYKTGQTFLEKVKSGTITDTTVKITDQSKKVMYSLTESLTEIGQTYGLRGVLNALNNIIVSNYIQTAWSPDKFEYQGQEFWNVYSGADVIDSDLKTALNKMIGVN